MEQTRYNIAKKLLKFYGKTGKRWTKGQNACDRFDAWTSWRSQDAVKFCAYGACLKMGITPSLAPFPSQMNSFIYMNDKSIDFASFRRKLERLAAKA